MASEDIRGTYQPSPIAGKLALITGATGGIGTATARLFASRGAHLALHYHTNASGASKLQASLTAQYPDLRVRTYQCDLADFDAVRAMHAQIVDEMGDVEVLYNNAAAEGTIMGIKGKIEDVKMEEVEGCWRSNVGAAFLLTQLCVPPMEKKGYGRVVFCSSIAAATGGVVGPHYASSKSALHGIMHWVANQYVRSGITCNAVAPALIANTQMFHTPTEAHRNLIPMGRFGQPEEIAQAVELLVTNSYMTNKIITVDGGLLPSSLA